MARTIAEFYCECYDRTDRLYWRFRKWIDRKLLAEKTRSPAGDFLRRFLVGNAIWGE